MRLTIALVGGHGAGKSTVGAALAAALGVPFHDEIGRRLATDRPPGQTAEHPQQAFDEAVFSAELARDAAWRSGVRVVETWHPGNLAYAARRSPAVVARNLPLALGPAVVIPIHASPAVAAARQNEPGDPTFFREVGEAAEAWARALGLRVLDPVRNDGPLAHSVAAALAQLACVEPALVANAMGPALVPRVNAGWAHAPMTTRARFSPGEPLATPTASQDASLAGSPPTNGQRGLAPSAAFRGASASSTAPPSALERPKPCRPLSARAGRVRLSGIRTTAAVPALGLARRRIRFALPSPHPVESA
jgi:hypothetical protein